jgi:ankyrin repeat protein
MNDWSEKEKLHFAVQENDLEQAKSLIRGGCLIDAFDELGFTPLHYAAQSENLEMAKFLIKSGADINAHDETQAGNTPLAEIASNCSYEMAKVLIDAGADPTIPGWMQLTALNRAEKRQRGDGPSVYRLLVEASRSSK